MRNQKGFAPVILLIIAGVVILGLFIFVVIPLLSVNPRKILEKAKVTNSAATSVENIDISKELPGAPIYPNAKFTKKEKLPTCDELKKTITDSGYPESNLEYAKSELQCDSTEYTFYTAAAFDDLVRWYEKDESGSGLKLAGGAGSPGGDRFGGLGQYYIYIGVDRTKSTEERYFAIRVSNH